MLAVFVEHGFVLDAAALLAGFHRSEDAAAFGDAVELGEDGFFDEVGELVDDEGALERVFGAGKAPFGVDDHLDGQGAAHGLR